MQTGVRIFTHVSKQIHVSTCINNLIKHYDRVLRIQGQCKRNYLLFFSSELKNCMKQAPVVNIYSLEHVYFYLVKSEGCV